MRWRSRLSRLAVLSVIALAFGWTRWELDIARAELRDVRARVEQMEGQQKYLPALLRTEFARFRQDLLAALERHDDRRDQAGGK